MSGGSLTELDGQCVRRERGCLGVALRPASLTRLGRAGAATHWLIPVEDIALVRSAAALPEEVFWLCRRPPSAVVGQLGDAMRGAWLEGSAVVVNLDGQPQRVALPEAPAGTDSLAVLADVVTRLWTGLPTVTDLRATITGHEPQLTLLAAA